MKFIYYNSNYDYTGIKDLRKIPVSSKIDMRTRGIEKFIMQGVDLLLHFHGATSGSSGIPLNIYKEEYARSLEIARWLRVLFANGYRITGRAKALIAPLRLVEGRACFQSFRLLRRCFLVVRITFFLGLILFALGLVEKYVIRIIKAANRYPSCLVADAEILDSD